MAPTGPHGVRTAVEEELPAVGRLLDEFNREFDEPTPGPAVLARRVGELLAGGDTAVLLAGRGPDGVAVLRFRRALWSSGFECYLAELYVVPEARGAGMGRALLQGALQHAAHGPDALGGLPGALFLPTLEPRPVVLHQQPVGRALRRPGRGPLRPPQEPAGRTLRTCARK